jgi:hypothetical protein
MQAKRDQRQHGKPPEFFFDNSPVVLFVELHIYNTVVLKNRGFAG